MLTVQEFADALGVGRAVIYRLAREKAIATVPIGRSLRIPRTEIQGYIDRNTTGVRLASW